MISWRSPDIGKEEARRRRALGEARAAQEALRDAGFQAAIYGSVLRPADRPFGFHSHSDVDIMIEPIADGCTDIETYLKVEPIVLAHIRAAPPIILLRDWIGEGPLEPFDPSRVLQRCEARLQKVLTDFEESRQIAAPDGDPAILRKIRHDAGLYRLDLMLRPVEKALKLALQAQLGWLPEVIVGDGDPDPGEYRQVLLSLAEGDAGNRPLLTESQAAILRQAGLLDAYPGNLDVSVDPDEAVAALLRVVPALLDVAHTQVTQALNPR